MDVVYEFATEYEYKIHNESKTQDGYSIVLESNNEYIEINIVLNGDKQKNFFEIYYHNPLDCYQIINMVNAISQKEFDTEFCFNVISNNDMFLGCDEQYYKKHYDFYKLDYLGISEDYCL